MDGKLLKGTVRPEINQQLRTVKDHAAVLQAYSLWTNGKKTFYYSTSNGHWMEKKHFIASLLSSSANTSMVGDDRWRWRAECIGHT